MNDIRTRLIRCFAGVFPKIPEEKIPTASQESTEGWDSVAAVTLFAVIQESFGLELEFEDMEKFDSFNRIFEYLSRHSLNSQPSEP